MIDTSSAPSEPLSALSDDTWTGQQLLAALQAGASWLKQHVGLLNSLNVFPVPDGDTGTNMHLTIMAALKDVEPHDSCAVVAERVYRGALMGARGNSGVILSQVLRGLAQGLDGHERCGTLQLAQALAQACAYAYGAVIKPVEGTMLTVIREASEAAQEYLPHRPGMVALLSKVVATAAESVKRTPALLKTLRDAGVVDAGAKGIYIVFEGMLRHARGEPLQADFVEDPQPAMAFHDVYSDDDFGYCTNFVVLGSNMPYAQIREFIAEAGRSVAVIGDEATIKVHVHTEHPGDMLNYAGQFGTLTQIEITNMDLQRAQLHAAADQAVSAPLLVDDDHPAPIGVVAVAPGAGWVELFRSLNVGAVLGGGQTMNPSTQDLLNAIESLPQEHVVVLPNNGNIVMAARQAGELSNRTVAVVPSKTLPQGVSALLALNYSADFAHNLQEMAAALNLVRTIEVTAAARDALLDGQQVYMGQIIGLLDDVLVASGDTVQSVVEQALERVAMDEHELITLYYGQDVLPEEAEQLVAGLGERYSHLAVETRAGDQPFYHYIIAVE